jgi:2-oxoglutarate ferredoxin oxidoreductase subunit gamma
VADVPGTTAGGPPTHHPESRFEVRVSGSGGQGILVAAAIVADAAAAQGKEVVQTQSYGPEARGGASKAEIVISDAAIDYPEVRSADLSLCMSQAAFDKYAAGTRPGGLIVYDSGLVHVGELAAVVLAGSDQSQTHRLMGVPFTAAAVERLGKKVVANIVAVGVLAETIGWLSEEAVEDAVSRRVPPKFRELNLKALRLGRELGVEALAAAGQTAR